VTSAILTGSLLTKATGRHDRFHYAGSPGAGSADAIDCQRRRSHGQTRVNSRLARWVHFHARLNDIAHNHCFDLVGTKPGACDRNLDAMELSDPDLAALSRRRDPGQGPNPNGDGRGF
jgi:hypothetical protein